MTTYIIRDGALVEKPRNTLARTGAYVPDIGEFRTTDGTVIGSRSHLRDYEQRHQVRQIGDQAKRAPTRKD